MIEIYYRALRDKNLVLQKEFRKGVWINAFQPDECEMKQISDMTKIEIDLMKDALDEFEVPRLEIDGRVVNIFTRVPIERNGVIKTLPILLTVGDDFVLTVSKERIEILEKFVQNQSNIFTTQKAKLFLAILSSINREYSRFLNSINKNAQALRFQMNKIKVNDIVKFVDIEKILNDFLSALIPTNTALENITNRHQLPYHESDIELINDLSVDFKQQIVLTKSILQHVINIRDAYSNVMTHDLNRVMKILTALTIILTIPTMIFSFYGMNVDLPLNASPISYLYIAIGTIIISSALLFVFIRNRWL